MYKLIKGLAGPETGERANAGFFQLARTVLWSFFGVRKKQGLETDALSITPLQAICAGLIGAVVLVLSLLMLVRFILS